MYYSLFFVTIIFIGIPDQGTAEVKKNGNNFRISTNDLSEIDTTVDDLLRKFLSPTSYSITANSIQGKSLSSQDKLMVIVPRVGDSICHELFVLLKQFGVFHGNNTICYRNNAGPMVENRKNPQSAVYYEMISFPYKLMKIGKNIATKIGKFYEKKNYPQRGYSKSNFILPTIGNRKSSGLEIVDTIDRLEIYINALIKCLKSKQSHYNVKNAARQLFKYSPSEFSQIVQRLLERKIPHNHANRTGQFSEIEASFCQVLVNSPDRKEFYNCLNEMRQIAECIRETCIQSTYSDKPLHQMSHKLVENVNDLHSGCRAIENNRNFDIICTKSLDSSKLIDNVIQHLPNSPETTNLIESINSYVAKSESGSRVLHEIQALMQVYNQGMNRKNKLLKMSKNKLNTMKQYRKYSASLNNYKKNLIDITLLSTKSVHSVAMNVEKSFVNAASEISGIDMSEYMVSMKCIIPLLASLFHERRPEVSSDNNHSQEAPEVQNFWNQYGRTRSSNLSNHVSPLKNLLASMKRITRMQMLRKKSTITTLANTFLLATLFFEGISILAAVMYRPEAVDFDPIDQVGDNFGGEERPWEIQRNPQVPDGAKDDKEGNDEEAEDENYTEEY